VYVSTTFSGVSIRSPRSTIGGAAAAIKRGGSVETGDINNDCAGNDAGKARKALRHLEQPGGKKPDRQRSHRNVLMSVTSITRVALT
jgi:hypothetical protein